MDEVIGVIKGNWVAEVEITEEVEDDEETELGRDSVELARATLGSALENDACAICVAAGDEVAGSILLLIKKMDVT